MKEMRVIAGIVVIVITMATLGYGAGQPSRSPDSDATRPSTTRPSTAPSRAAVESLIRLLRDGDNVVADMMYPPRLLAAEERQHLVAALENSAVKEGGIDGPMPLLPRPSQSIWVLRKGTTLDGEDIEGKRLCDITIYASLEFAVATQPDKASLILSGKSWRSFPRVKE